MSRQAAATAFRGGFDPYEDAVQSGRELIAAFRYLSAKRCGRRAIAMES